MKAADHVDQAQKKKENIQKFNMNKLETSQFKHMENRAAIKLNDLLIQNMSPFS